MGGLKRGMLFHVTFEGETAGSFSARGAAVGGEFGREERRAEGAGACGLWWGRKGVVARNGVVLFHVTIVGDLPGYYFSRPNIVIAGAAGNLAVSETDVAAISAVDFSQMRPEK